MTKAIEKIQTEKGVMFAELDLLEKQAVMANPTELQKLLAHSHTPTWNQPADFTGLLKEPVKKLRRKRRTFVTVRCNRETGLWELLDKDKNVVRTIERGILADVKFSTIMESVKLRGCGGDYDSKVYVGLATGQLLPKDSPVVIPESSIMRLSFDIYTGRFLYRENNANIYRTGVMKEMKDAAYLILKDKCHSEVIIQPNAKK